MAPNPKSSSQKKIFTTYKRIVSIGYVVIDMKQLITTKCHKRKQRVGMTEKGDILRIVLKIKISQFLDLVGHLL